MSPVQAAIEATQQKTMEYDFHTAGYHTLMEVVNALKTVAGHLIKVRGRPPSSTVHSDIHSLNSGTAEVLKP